MTTGFCPDPTPDPNSPEGRESEARLALRQREESEQHRLKNIADAQATAWHRDRMAAIRAGRDDPGPFPGSIEQAIEEEDSTAARTIGLAAVHDGDGPNYAADDPPDHDVATPAHGGTVYRPQLPGWLIEGRRGRMSLGNFQNDVHAWILHNFGEQSDLVLYGGTGEEVGEVLRGAVKREQGIRGTKEEWDATIRAEIGDVAIKLASICAKEDWDLASCIMNRWLEVRQRVWSGADKTGHGLPEE